MVIIEIDNGKFVNMQNVFKFDLINLEKGDKCFIRFYNSNETNANSKVFENPEAAKDWIATSIIRAAGSNEILHL